MNIKWAVCGVIKCLVGLSFRTTFEKRNMFFIGECMELPNNIRLFLFRGLQAYLQRPKWLQAFIPIKLEPYLIPLVQSVHRLQSTLRCASYLAGMKARSHTGPLWIRLITCVIIKSTTQNNVLFCMCMIKYPISLPHSNYRKKKASEPQNKIECKIIKPAGSSAIL